MEPKELIEHLKKYSEDSDYFLGVDFKNIVEIAGNPNWENYRKCHDWKNYVDDPICEIWDKLSLDARIAIYVICDGLAHNESWS